MAAHAAAPIVGIIGDARQQLAGTRGLDHRNGTIRDRLRQPRVERYKKVQALAGVGIEHGEERGIRHIEIGLIGRGLRRVDLIEPNESVALDGAPALGAKGLVFPDRRIDQALDLRPGDKNPVRVASELPAGRFELQASALCELEAGRYQMPARDPLEEMAALENVARARRKLRIAEPIVLDAAQALGTDRGCAKILAVVRTRRLGRFNQRVDLLIERPCRQDRTV